jgi:predicted HicB family RNase H-like nuclease
VKVLEHKGYTATVDLDADDGILVGRVIGVNDVITFHGTTVKEVVAAFRESIDDYLAACAKLGQSPDKPASGKFMVRAAPLTHRAALAMATAEGKSLNTWVVEVIERAVGRGDGAAGSLAPAPMRRRRKAVPRAGARR